MAKKKVSVAHDLPFSMCLEGAPTVERHFLYIPAKRYAGRIGTYKFHVVEKGKRAEILLNVFGGPDGLTITPGRYPLFSKKDTERAMNIIGDAIANRVSAAVSPTPQQ